MKIEIMHDSRTEPAPTVTIIDTKPPPVVDPPPLPPSTITVVQRLAVRPRAIIMGAMLPDLFGHTIFQGFSDRNRYARWQPAVELAGQTTANPLGVGPKATIRGIIEITANSTTPQLTFGVAWTAVVTLTPRVGATIMLPPVPVAAADVFFDVIADLTKIPEVDGGYLLSVTGYPPGWSVLDYPVYVRQTAKVTIPQTQMLVVVGSYTHANNGNKFAYAWVPAKFAPVAEPLAPRAYPPFNPKDMTELAYTLLAPYTRADGYRPSQMDSGVWTSANTQNYGFASMYQLAEPFWPVRQGPRAVGNQVCVTALRVTKRPDTNKWLFAQPHNIGTGSGDGTINIEIGYYHDTPPPYTSWNSSQQMRPPAKLLLAGDWSAMPATRRVPKEIWDVAVDDRTTVLNTTVPPVGTPPEPPHLFNVRKYVANTGIDNVLAVTYDKTDRSVTPKVTEFLYKPGGKPWNLECVGGTLYVTWQGMNLFEAYDMGPPDAPLAQGKLLWSMPFTKPEGMRIDNGIAYIGSSATWTISKVDLATRAVTKFLDVIHNGNSLFVNLAVADGLLAYCTWSNDTYGVPVVVNLSDGVRRKVGASNNGWGDPKGTFFPGGLGYMSAVALGGGRLIWGCVQEGLHQLSTALPTDLAVPAAVYTGAVQWHDLSLDIAHGDLGFPWHGQALPWGKYGPQVDEFLKNLHPT